MTTSRDRDLEAMKGADFAEDSPRREYAQREIYRRGGRYEFCQVLTEWTSAATCPKYIACNSLKRGDQFIAKQAMGTWCEVDIFEVQAVLTGTFPSLTPAAPAGWMPDAGVMKIVQEIAEKQHAKADGIAPLDGDEAHAHVATLIDLWNRFVCRIPGLNEYSIREPIPAPPTTQEQV